MFANMDQEKTLDGKLNSIRNKKWIKGAIDPNIINIYIPKVFTTYPKMYTHSKIK